MESRIWIEEKPVISLNLHLTGAWHLDFAIIFWIELEILIVTKLLFEKFQQFSEFLNFKFSIHWLFKLKLRLRLFKEDIIDCIWTLLLSPFLKKSKIIANCGWMRKRCNLWQGIKNRKNWFHATFWWILTLSLNFDDNIPRICMSEVHFCK